MSSRRIIIGLFIGGCFLAGGLAAVWYLGLPAQFLPIALLLVAAVCGGAMGYIHRSKSLRPYWERGCMGIRWRRRFPNSSKTDIREFLDIFVDAFAFNQKKRSRFSPDDRVMDVYRALYPPGDCLADCLELETLAVLIQERYAINLRAVLRDDITLGELYQHTRGQTS
jgi:propanediol dehydratase small subunit